MFKLEPRPAPSKVLTLASPLIALAITVVIGVILFMSLGKDPVAGLRMFFIEPLKSGYALSELSLKATPLILIALGLSVHRWMEVPADKKALPAVEVYYRRLLDRPAGARWMARDTP